MKVKTLGLDLAKNVFQIHGINELGKPVITKQLKRNQMAEFFVNLPPCLIGMQACGSAHHWARILGTNWLSLHQRQKSSLPNWAYSTGRRNTVWLTGF